MMGDRQPLRMALGERVEVGREDGALPVAVRVQQAHPAVGGLERGLQQRIDRRDAAPAGVRDEVAGRFAPRQKTPAGRVDSSGSPAPSESAIQFETSPPATRFTVTCSSRVDLGGGRHRVRAQHPPAVDGHPERQELPGPIGECAASSDRHVEHERHRFAGFGDDAANPQRVEAVCPRHFHSAPEWRRSYPQTIIALSTSGNVSESRGRLPLGCRVRWLHAEERVGRVSRRELAVARVLDPARARAETRIQRFLDAALELMSASPDREFTVQEVVERSGQSLRSFYQYFEGKYELLVALFEDSVR